MGPGDKKDESIPLSTSQLEITKAAIDASARITAAMVAVTTEKNPAKISEAYRVIYKTVLDTVKTAQKKPTGGT
ncbi:MAG: hypothetical protein IPG45_07225 [Deltaproteobacteria bacterium]|jgi:hypothetical protein|nr:hypothetical protein [Deltaproteobacteria bacterium]